MSETITLKPISKGTSTGLYTNASYAYDDDITTSADIYQSKTTSKPSSTKSYSATAYVYYNMDFSQIPSGVEIVGATLNVIGRRVSSSTNYTSLTTSTQVSPYDDTTSLQKYIYFTSNAMEQKSVTLTSEQATAWVNSLSPRVRCYAHCTGKAKTPGSSCVREIHIEVYDIYATIEYQYPSTIKAKVDGEWVNGTIKTKVDGEWVDATALYTKCNGTWIQIE